MRRTPNSSANSSPTQSFHSSLRLKAYKNDQDKDSLKPGSSEYSKSGSDSAAAHTGEAFDGNQTRPEQEGRNVEGENNSKKNPLNVSPANTEVSKGKGDKVEKGDHKDRQRTSGAGSAPKAGS